MRHLKKCMEDKMSNNLQDHLGEEVSFDDPVLRKVISGKLDFDKSLEIFYINLDKPSDKYHPIICINNEADKYQVVDGEVRKR